jgi:hypothetical protein
MEKHLGRYLTKNEVVHHIDGNIKNNDINNLQLFKNHGEHTKYAHPEVLKRMSEICKTRVVWNKGLKGWFNSGSFKKGHKFFKGGEKSWIKKGERLSISS